MEKLSKQSKKERSGLPQLEERLQEEKSAAIKKRIKEIEREALEEARREKERITHKALEGTKEKKAAAITKKIKEIEREALEEARREKEPSAATRGALEELRAVEKEKIKQEGGKLRKELAEPEEEPYESYEVLPAEEAVEQIQIPDKELDKDFTKLEKEWFAKEPEEKKEILENNEESAEMFYRNQLDHLHAQDPKKYPSGKEYVESSDTLEFFDQRKQQIELELQNKFGYDFLKGGWWASLKARKKLDPADNERFTKLFMAYKNTDKSYRERFKKHMKKYGEVIDLITPRGKTFFAERGRHPELGPPKFW